MQQWSPALRIRTCLMVPATGEAVGLPVELCKLSVVVGVVPSAQLDLPWRACAPSCDGIAVQHVEEREGSQATRQIEVLGSTRIRDTTAAACGNKSIAVILGSHWAFVQDA